MKIELKSLKVFEEMSQETLAYKADLWLNGEYIATARNDGNGGDTLILFLDKSIRQKVESFFSHKLDSHVDSLVFEYYGKAV